MHAKGNGGFLPNLTNNSTLDWFPSWAPDNSKIAFTHRTQVNLTYSREVYRMNPDGSAQEALTAGGSSGEGATRGQPDYSPDSQQIVYVSGHNLWKMNADGTGKTQLTSDGVYPSVRYEWPCWSPHGAKIVYTHKPASSDNRDIYVMNPDGTNPVRLTDDPATDELPSWSWSMTLAPTTGSVDVVIR